MISIDNLLGNIKIEIQKANVTFDNSGYLDKIIDSCLKPAMREMGAAYLRAIDRVLEDLKVPTDSFSGRDPETWKKSVIVAIKKLRKPFTENMQLVYRFSLDGADPSTYTRARVIAFGNMENGIPQMGPSGRMVWDTNITGQHESGWPYEDESEDVPPEWRHPSGTNFFQKALEDEILKEDIEDIFEGLAMDISSIDISEFIDCSLS